MYLLKSNHSKKNSITSLMENRQIDITINQKSKSKNTNTSTIRNKRKKIKTSGAEDEWSLSKYEEQIDKEDVKKHFFEFENKK